MSATEIPDVFSVEEAAAVLHISRGKAYEQARLFLTTNGAKGLPVIPFGRAFRVPRAGLEQLLGGELRAVPVKKAVSEPGVRMTIVEDSSSTRETPKPERSPRSRARRHAHHDSQLSLFDLPSTATPDLRP